MGKTLTQQMAEMTRNEVYALWGGRAPTWEEYKEAYLASRVRADKSIATLTINTRGVPTIAIIHSVITALIGYLALPASIAWYFISNISGWWIVGGFAASYFFMKVSREVQCEGIKLGAFKNEELYRHLLECGAFLFGPSR